LRRCFVLPKTVGQNHSIIGKLSTVADDRIHLEIIVQNRCNNRFIFILIELFYGFIAIHQAATAHDQHNQHGGYDFLDTTVHTQNFLVSIVNDATNKKVTSWQKYKK